jgi:hypothetical protein
MFFHVRFRTAAAVATAVAVLFGGTIAVGCGDSGASKEELQEARQSGAKKAQEQQKIRQIQRELKELKKHGGSGGSGPPGSSPAPASVATSGNCGGSLSVNEHTTCVFAEAVEDGYYEEVGSGSGTVFAYSPATGRTYTMYCTAGSPHECTGGNDAAVYFP